MTVITAVLSLSRLESTEHHKMHLDMEPLPRRVAIMTTQKAPSAIRRIKTFLPAGR